MFEQIKKLLRLIGGTVYARTGEPMILNFQNRNGYIPPYQARQLIGMLDKYEG